MASPANSTEETSENEGKKLASETTTKHENCGTNIEDQHKLNVLLKDEPIDIDTDEKNLEDMLLAGGDTQELGDSENPEDEMQLKWDDDDLDNDDGSKEVSSAGDPLPSLSFQDEVIKTIDDEEKLLDLDNDNVELMESPTASLADNSLVTKVCHNLNKPDMMLEIPTQEAIECSDDESDFSDNLEMSPDSVIDDVITENEADNESKVVEVHAEDDIPSKPTLIDNLESEAKLAADIITKELNAMASETDILMDNIEISNDEEVLFEKDDIMLVQEEIEVTNDINKDSDATEEIVETVEQATTDNFSKEPIICELDESEEEDIQDVVMSEISEDKLLYSPTCENETRDFPADKIVEPDGVGTKGSDTENFKVNDEQTSIDHDMSYDIIEQKTNQEISQNKNSEVSDLHESTVSLGMDKDETISDPKPEENENSQSCSDFVTLEIKNPEPSTSLGSGALVTSLVNKTIAVINNIEAYAYIKDFQEPATNFNKEESTENPSKLTETHNVPSASVLDQKLPQNNELTNEKPLKQNITAHPMDKDDPQPSTSSAALPFKNSTSNSLQSKSTESSIFDSLTQDTSKDMPETADSLGLLAESSRVMDEDEEQDDYDEGEDEDDFDPDDESSNQMTAEHSEDSNAQQSESDKDPFVFPTTSVSTDIVVKTEIMECDIIEMNQENKNVMEIDTVKLSDTSDIEIEDMPKSMLKTLLQGEEIENDAIKQSTEEAGSSETIIIDLEDNIGDDNEEQKVEPQPDTIQEPLKTTDDEDVKPCESVSSPKSPKHVTPKPVTLTTNEITAGDNLSNRPRLGLEVFNLDSDEEEEEEEVGEENVTKVTDKTKPEKKCINILCQSDSNTEFYVAEKDAMNYYEADKKGGYICGECASVVEKRNQDLVHGVKNFAPLIELGLTKTNFDLVEISDSESEGEPEPEAGVLQLIGEDDARIAEEKLADMFNETWIKFKMDDRLKETETEIQKQIKKLQNDWTEIDEMLKEGQAATDKLRNELYATFATDIRELPPFVIYDTPNCAYSCMEPSSTRFSCTEPSSTRHAVSKRKHVAAQEVPAKRPAIPLGYKPLGDKTGEIQKRETFIEKQDDDNMEVSVVKLSAESAPKDLPPPGEITLAPIKVGMVVYAMKNAYGSWLKARVVEILPKAPNQLFTNCRVKFEHKVSKNPFKILPGRCLAYYEPSDVRMTIGRRVIALSKNNKKGEAFYSGIVAEIPNPVNSYRYLIFFDDGYAQYAQHTQTRLVCECSSLVWEEVHPFSRKFVKQYLFAYPERPMVRLHEGQSLKTEWRGKWWSSRVVRVDASLVEVTFLRQEKREWIYRGSTRLAPLYLELEAAGRQRPRAVRRAQPLAGINMPYVEYTRSEEQNNKAAESRQQNEQLNQNEEMRRQRAVAKKSTTSIPVPSQPTAANVESTSRVVYYSPKNAVKPHKMVPHTCSPDCKRTDVLTLKDLRTYNPLAKPLLSGWERQTVRWKGQRSVLYVAPCGRRVRDMRELHRYLRIVESDMPVDLFDFSAATHCLAEFVLTNHYVGKKDLSHGKENVPVPCVNYYDDSLPEFCSYNTERTPTAGVPLNLDPDFLCGCDCEDDCVDKTKCACWKLTLEGARTIGLKGNNVGYVYKRLPEPLQSGIYECNSRCKCKQTCLNRVAQHPLQLKLQVFKTQKRGWGIRALNDVPKGSFLCVYAGNLLTDATANLDGLNEGDEYLAELDYIEVVEQMKEGYEEDIPEKIKKLDLKESEAQMSDTESSEEEIENDKTDEQDDDFQPGYIGMGVAEFNKRLRRRNSKLKEDTTTKKENNDKESNPEDECITISDDEEAREPSCFTAAAGMGANEFVSKYRSVRTLFGEDEACYIMDAKVQGNIGRYLNHSCAPNVFVQNVFVDTHDPRFPWVAFFALSHIRAGTELTWNYNYDVGSVPDKVLYCYCGAPNCRGRLL